MRKMSRLFLTFFFCVCFSVVFVSAFGDGSSVVIGSDVPEGWYFLPAGCAVSLPDGVSSSALLPATASFTAPIGEYVVGVDIPAGSYSVRCDENSYSTTVKFCTDDSGLWFLLETLHSEEGEYIGKVDLLDGYTVSVRNGPAVFSAPSGIVFN